MATNFPGISAGLNTPATQAKHAHKQIPADAGETQSVQPHAPVEDVFAKRADSQAEDAAPSKAQLKEVLQGLRDEARKNPELEVFPPEEKPKLRRNNALLNLRAVQAEDEKSSNAQKDHHAADLTSPFSSPRQRRVAMSVGERSQASGFQHSPDSTENLMMKKGFGQAVETGQGNHQRNRMSIEDQQAMLEKAREIAEQKAEAQPASHAELVKLFNVPYRYTLLKKGNMFPNASPSMAAEELKKNHQLVIGDMHASFLKLMETLVVADLVEMPKKSAERFVKLAECLENCSSNLGHWSLNEKERRQGYKKLRQAYQSMEKVIPTIRWKGGDRQLFLLGDMLSDRGPLDTVTLALMKHLKQQAPPGKIVWLASNHDHNALNVLTTGEQNLYPVQAVSMNRAIDMAEGKDATVLAEDYYDYLAESKLMHLDKASKTLMAHAPISEINLRKLHALLPKGTPAVEDIQDLDGVGRFVDAANQFYPDYVRHNRQMLDKSKQMRHQEDELPGGDWIEDLLERRNQVEPVLAGNDGFLWVRNSLSDKSKLPFRKAGVETLVHGHDLASENHSPFSLYKLPDREPGYSVVTLDQEVRKEAFRPINTMKNRSRLYLLG